jgi:hypothetical protein
MSLGTKYPPSQSQDLVRPVTFPVRKLVLLVQGGAVQHRSVRTRDELVCKMGPIVEGET